MLGDGWIQKGFKFRTYTTASPKLAMDVLEIILKCGYGASFWERKNKCGYDINIINKHKIVNVQSPQIKEVEYDGIVYCCEVPKYHTLITERNGSIKIDSNSFQETEFTLLRNTMREAISAIWGVSPVWQNVTSGFGGVAKESAQIEVMDRTIENDQKIYNDIVLPKILKAAGITDWELKLKPPVEKTEIQELDILQRKAQLMQLLTSMGFEVTLEGSGQDLSFSVQQKKAGKEEDLLSDLLEDIDEGEESKE